MIHHCDEMPVPTMKFFDSPQLFTNAVFEKLVVAEGKQTQDVINRVTSACKEQIQDGGVEFYSQLPLITADNLASMEEGAVVRYRCMIQDIRGPEYFESIYSTTDAMKPNVVHLHCNLWQETLQIPDGEEYCLDRGRHEISERLVFVGSPNPADTHWVKRYHNAEHTAASSISTVSDIGQTAYGQCLLKVFKDGERIKLNDTVEVVGIYYRRMEATDDPADLPSLMDLDNDADSDSTKNATLPSIHVLHIRNLHHQHPAPTVAIVDLHGAVNDWHSHLRELLSGEIIAIRTKLVSAFQDHLFNGDGLASEYLLCHLLSSVYTRRDTLAVGQMSMNFFNFPKTDDGSGWTVDRLLPILDRLLTQLAYLPLSLSTLNDTSLVPRKCFQTDRLVSARLQLPRRTELIIDETKLGVGQVNEQGVKNLDALRGLVKRQTLSYDFTYSSVEIQTDIRTLIVSEGPSMLPHDFSVPVTVVGNDGADTGTSDVQLESTIFGDKAFLDGARIYFALGQLSNVLMDDSMQRHVQADFVQMRQGGSQEMNAVYLERLLILARALAKTSGDADLRIDHWEKAKQMESERLKRIRSIHQG